MIVPYDLSASMGSTAKFDNPRFVAAMASIKSKTEQAGIPCGLHVVTPSEDDLRNKLDDGFRFIAYSIDSVFLNQVVASPVIKGK